MDNIWTVYGSLLSFDTPKEETMQDNAQFKIRSTDTKLCYDLARDEKATDGKKICRTIWGAPVQQRPLIWQLQRIYSFSSEASTHG